MPAKEAGNSESKTALILSLIAEQGPKTEYDLYKQLANLSHGTIHFCLSKLHQEGYLTPASNAASLRKKKQFQLTFRGAILYLNSLSLEPPMDLPIFTEQTLKEMSKSIGDAKKQFIKEHKSEFEKLSRFLENCGKQLDYDLFKESPWLVEHFGHSVLYDVLYAAKVLEAFPPAPAQHAFIDKKIGEISEKLKWLADAPSVNQEKTTIAIESGDKAGNQNYDDQLAALCQELKVQNRQLTDMLLNSKSWVRADSWRRAFAAIFARRFLMSNSTLDLKGGVRNEVLAKFFSEVAHDIYVAEITPFEKMISIFGKAKD